jgi:multicomponent K+:H+ antiporter subunit D
MVLAADWRRVKAGLALVSCLLQVAVAVALLLQADADIVRVYRVGDWPSLFGIVLVLDRLSALMLVLVSVLGLSALVFSLARWHRVGVHFHPLLQFQLMGLNGAFLTGDLFNLFVFFEVLLAASYGLALHGSGAARIRAGLHYVAINLVASLLFLVGVTMIYGVAGTLNMADLAGRIGDVAAADRALVEAGAAILGIAFLIKAGMWPMGFWLPTTYTFASAPAAAVLSILSKVGVYAVLRLWLLLFGGGAGASAAFGGDWLFVGGLLTIAFGSIAVLATQNMARLAGASVLVSSGTLLAAVGTGQVAVIGGALFYLASSVLAIGAFFLLVELVERGREVGADLLAVTREAFGGGEEEEPEEEVGVAIPATMALLGISFMGCALLLAGLPPFPGFLAKFAMLAPLFGPDAMSAPIESWALLAALIISGLVTMVAMTRAGINAIWVPHEDTTPRVGVVEIAPVALLLLLTVGLTVGAGPAMRYMEATARSLQAPGAYIGTVLSEAPGATDEVRP